MQVTPDQKSDIFEENKAVSLNLTFKTTNTILYCQKWSETIAFYRDKLELPILFASDWFVEFELDTTARLSLADEQRAKIKSSHGAGIRRERR